MTKVGGFPQQRSKVRITCPICDRSDIGTNTAGQMSKHNPHHQDWLWTPWCGGGGETLEGAEAIQAKIELLVREGFMLRQVEHGYQATKPYPDGSAVGMTQAHIDVEQDKAAGLASGVEHSVDILRGEPLFGEDDPDPDPADQPASANIYEDMASPTPRRRGKDY